MADLEKTIQVIFSGVDQMSGALTSVGTGINNFAGNVESATQPLADLTTSLLAIEAAFAALAAYGLYEAVTQAGEFNDAFAEISTLIDAPAESIDQFRRNIIDYTRDSTQSFEEINQAVYDAISAGTEYTDSLELLERAERLGIATKADLGTAVNLLVPTMNAFGAGTDEAGDYADILFTAIKNGKTTLDEIEPSLARVTGVASGAGLSFEEIAAAMAALTAGGAPTSQAITGIQAAITNILKPSGQARDLANDLGIEFNAEALAAEGLAGFLNLVYSATGGNVTQMGQLFGSVEALNTVLALGADASGAYADTLEAMADRAGVVEEAYRKMAENFQLINQNLVNNIRATITEIGLPLLDDWSGLAGSIGDIFAGVSISFGEGSFDPLFDKLVELADDLTNWLAGIATALPDAFALVEWDEFTDSIDGIIGELVDLFRAFFGELDFTEPEDLAEAIQQIVDSFTALNNVVAGILDAFEPFIEAISDYIDELLDADADTQRAAGQILAYGTAINQVAGFIGDLGGSIDFITGAFVTMAGSQVIRMVISRLGQFGGAASVVSSALGQIAIGAAAFGVGWVIGDWLRENIPLVAEFGDGLAKIVLYFQGLDEATISAYESAARETEEMGNMAVEAVRLAESLGQLPSQHSTDVEVQGGQQATLTVEELEEAIAAVPVSKTTNLFGEADVDSINEAAETIEDAIPGEKDVLVITAPDRPAIEQTKEAVEEIPSQRILEIQLQGEIDTRIAEIQAQADTLQTAFEWQAKVDIAEVEAVFDALEASSEAIATMFESTGDVILGIASLLGDADSTQYLDLMQLIREENARRDEMLRLQQEITAAEIEFLEAKTEALKAGEGLIKIEAEGVYPELELVLFKIIELAQIRANEEGLNFLLGV